MKILASALALAALLASSATALQQSKRVPVAPMVTVGEQENASGSGVPSGSGRTWRSTWLHDPDATGPLEPIEIQVEYEPKPGETATQAAAKFANDLEAMQATFPPNVRRGA